MFEEEALKWGEREDPGQPPETGDRKYFARNQLESKTEELGKDSSMSGIKKTRNYLRDQATEKALEF